MLRMIAIALSALFALGAPSQAQTANYPSGVLFEEGPFPYHEEDNTDWTVRGAAGVRPMAQLGTDAFRFTFDASSALRKSYVYEARRSANGAVLQVTWLDRRSAGGWTPTRRQRFRIQSAEYERLATEIDEQLRLGREDAERVRSGEEQMLCNDGFALRTERIVDGRESWMENGCGPDDPNEAIDRMLRDFVLDRIGG
jgi:hypothetical protein